MANIPLIIFMWIAMQHKNNEDSNKYVKSGSSVKSTGDSEYDSNVQMVN